MQTSAGTSLPSILVQPKRLALLAYVAITAPGGFIRRDLLLPLLWPELDEARARNALNKAVHHIRQALGDGVLINRGDEELGLAPGRFSSDVVEFERAVDQQAWEEALRVYRGELLPGLYLAGAPGFEEWLERERSRLKRLGASAAGRAAEARAANGDLRGAAEAARLAVSLDPDDEPAVRRLITLLDQQGDRAGAMRVYEDLVARLHRDFEVEPDAETQALRDAIGLRSVPSADRPAPARAHDPASPMPRGASASEPPRRWFARAALFGLGAVAAVLLILVASRYIRPRIAPPSPHTFAILPFTTSGTDTSLVRLGHDLMVLVSARVHGIADIEVIDPVAVVAQLSARGGDGSDLRLRSALQSLGATQILQGSLIRIGDQVRIDGRLFAVGEGQRVATIELTAPAADLVALADSVVLQIVAQTWPSGSPAASGAPMLSTRSLPALRAFLDGERLLADGRGEEAEAQYGAAIAADSSFWFAYWRYLYYRDQFGRSRDSALATRLREHRDQLPEPERTLVEARFTDSLAVRRRLLAAAAVRYPSSWDAWYNYADFLYHWAPFLGGTYAEAHQALERTVTLNPGFTDAWDHLFVVSLHEGDTITARHALDELGRLQYDSATAAGFGFDVLRLYRWYYVTLKAGGEPEPALSDTIAAAWVAYHGPVSVAVFDVGPLRFGLAEAQLDIGRRVLGLAPSRAIADGQLRGMALAWASRGAWDSALATTDRYAAGTSLAVADLFRYRLAVIGAWLGGVSPAEAQRRRTALAQRLTELPADSEGEVAWLDGVLAAARGDVEGIERARQRLRGVPGRMGGWLDGSLAGLSLDVQGDRAGSVAALARVEGERIDVHPYDLSNFGQPYLTAVNRMVLSRGLAATGDTVGALRQLRWTEAYLQVSALEQVRALMAGLVDLERARLEEASGQEELARGHYRQFLRRYDMPVAAHRALVAESRDSLARLDKVDCSTSDPTCREPK